MKENPTTVESIREKAIDQHRRLAGDFDSKYQRMLENYFVSAFLYGRYKLDVLLNEVVATAPKGGHILDVGCGTGEQIKGCRAKGFNLSGIEPAAEMRVIAQRNNPDVSIEDGIITSIPFADASFDLVMAIEVLRYLHQEDIQQAYREMLRVLKSGGVMFFTMVNRYAGDGFILFDKLKRLLLSLRHRDLPAHCEFVTPGQVKRELQALNVSEVNCYGRLFGPLRTAYKINQKLGSFLARRLEAADDSICQKSWMVPFAGHLIVIVKK